MSVWVGAKETEREREREREREIMEDMHKERKKDQEWVYL